MAVIVFYVPYYAREKGFLTASPGTHPPSRKRVVPYILHPTPSDDL